MSLLRRTGAAALGVIGLVLAFGLCGTTTLAAPKPPLRAAHAYTLPRTEQFTLKAVDGRPFQISIARPAGPAPKPGYPVIYVLDPSSAFATLADAVRNQEIYFGPVVVVGIGYVGDEAGVKRMLDMTPPTDLATLPKEFLGKPWPPVGGGDAFFAFIQERVKPAVERRLRIDHGRQALFGHSLGGLFTLHTLFTHPEAFQTYVAGSPSIWWGRRSVLAEARAFKAHPPVLEQPRRLLMTIGGWEEQSRPEDEAALAKLVKPAEVDHVIKEMRVQLQGFAPIANCRELAALLNQPPTAGLEAYLVEFPHETHNSVIPSYLSRGAYFTLVPASAGN